MEFSAMVAGYGECRAEAAAADRLQERLWEAKKEGVRLRELVHRGGPSDLEDVGDVEDASIDGEEVEPEEKAPEEEGGWDAERFADLVRRVEAHKESGNAAFREARVEASRSLAQDAAIHYLDALEVVETAPPSELSAAQAATRKHLLLTLFLNRSAALNEDLEWKLSLRAANAALGIDPENIKGLYRRGVALAGLRRFAEAEGDFNTVLRLDPENREARRRLVETTKKRKIYHGHKMRDNNVGRRDDRDEAYDRWGE